MPDHSADWIAEFRHLEIDKVFYLAPLDNLHSILANGVLSLNEVTERDLANADISEPSVQERRDTRGLHDFVPLYFARLTPMSSRRRDRTGELCILVIKVATVCDQAGLLWFTDGNAASAETSCYSNPSRLRAELPLQVINADYWTNHEDGKRRRCAELLVHPSVSTTSIEAIEVANSTSISQVNAAINDAQASQPSGWTCKCVVNPASFFT